MFYCLRSDTSLFVASYDSQGHGGDIRLHLHTCHLLTRSADCQDNFSARTPRKTPSSFVKDAYLQLRCPAIDFLLFRELLGADRIENTASLVMLSRFKGRVFTGRRIETAVLLLLPVFVIVRMFTAFLYCYRNGPYVTLSFATLSKPALGSKQLLIDSISRIHHPGQSGWGLKLKPRMYVVLA
jgi:hypothetical protein